MAGGLPPEKWRHYAVFRYRCYHPSNARHRPGGRSGRVGRSQSAGGLRLGQCGGQKPGHQALDTQIEVQENTNKTVVYAAVLGVILQDYVVFSQLQRYNS